MQRLKRLEAAFHVAVARNTGAVEMAQFLARCRLAFNSSIAQDVNMRVFETLAMGRPLLSNRDAGANGLFDLFVEDVHLFTYDDHDLLDQARRILADDALHSVVAETGHQEVLARHTYGHRVDTLLETVQEAVAAADSGAAIPREGTGLAAWLPHGARRVVDLGLGLDRSKLALRPRGIRELIGVSHDAAALSPRRNSYNETAGWPASALRDAGADAVLCAIPGAPPRDLMELLDGARAMLAEGGHAPLASSRGILGLGRLGRTRTWARVPPGPPPAPER